MGDFEDAPMSGIGGLEALEGGLDGNMRQWAEGRALQKIAQLDAGGPGRPGGSRSGFRGSPGHPSAGPPGGGGPHGPRGGNGPSGGPDSPNRIRALRSAARKVHHRTRRHRLPWLALVLLPATAAIGHHLERDRLTIGLILAAAGLIAAAVMAFRSKAPELPEGAGMRVRVFILARWAIRPACVLSAGLWVWLACVAGLSRPVLLTFVIGWCGPALIHWNRHRNRHRHGKPEKPAPEPPPAPPAPERNVLLENLRDRLCGTSGPFHGATITEAPSVEGGRVFDIDLVPGRQTTATVLGATRQIASAAETALTRIVAEGVPGEVPGEPGPENKARVTILGAKHLHTGIQEYDGPTLNRETGLYVVGPYPDGDPAHARLFKVDEHGNPMRAASGLTAGAAGSGKSRFAERKDLEHLASGLFKVFLLDGQGGASIPDLIDYVAWPALRPEEWEICLRAALRLMVTRTRWMASKGLSYWPARPDNPFVQLDLQEAHKILANPICLRATKSLLQEGEKAGIGLDISTQFPSQVELGGASGTQGANVLRDLASSGNVTLFRTGSEFAKNVTVGNIEVSPRNLPQRPGACFALGASMRVAPVRAIRAEHPKEWVHTFQETWFTDLDIRALDGDDEAFTGREERIAKHLEEPDAGSLNITSIEEEVRLMLGEAVAGQSQAPGNQKANLPALILKVLRDGGRQRRRAVIDAVKQAAGYDYSDSAVDQAFAALKRAGATTADGGMWEAVRKLSAVPNTK